MRATNTSVEFLGNRFGLPTQQHIDGDKSTYTIRDNTAGFSCGVCYRETETAVCIDSFFPEMTQMMNAENEIVLLSALKSWVRDVAAVGERKLYASSQANTYWWHCYWSIGIADDLIEMEQVADDNLEHILATALGIDDD